MTMERNSLLVKVAMLILANQKLLIPEIWVFQMALWFICTFLWFGELTMRPEDSLLMKKEILPALITL